VILDFRAATVDDADSVADVYLRSRKELVACAPLVHSDDDVRDWIRRKLIPAGCTTVAVADGRVIGVLTVSRGTDCSWIDQLYLLPDWVQRGIGTQLLELALRKLVPPIRLYTFQCNELATSMNAGDSERSPSETAPVTRRSVPTSCTSGGRRDDRSGSRLRLIVRESRRGNHITRRRWSSSPSFAVTP
jgi:GNAT superfamily N-acetyltransferase